MDNLERKSNIKTYLEMFFNNTPATDNFRTAFTFMQKIYDYAKERFVHDFPFDITWELTSGCNLRCKHCYIQDKENAYSTNNDLSAEDTLLLANNLCEFFEACHVTLTGGEPFLNPKIMDIIRVFKEHHTALYIQTNGTLLTSETILELSELLNKNMDVVQISLDGIFESHNTIRGKDIYSKVIANIKQLIEKNIFVSVNCTMTKLNYNEIVPLFLMCNEIGVNRFTVTKLLVTNDEHKQYQLTYDEIFKVLADIIHLKTSQNLPIITNLVCFKFVELVNDSFVREVLDEFLEGRNENIELPVCLNCHHREKISIKPDGKIYLCPEVVSPKAMLGDLKIQSLDEIWETIDSHPLYQSRETSKMVCKNCKYLLKCKSGCMGENFVKTGSIYSKSVHCSVLN